MKIKKGFSLADILITISVVAIIASVSLSFFKQSEPDKRIYDSTVRQLSRVIAAVNYKACSDDLMCWNSGTRGISSPGCPNYGANVVPFINNQCTHTTDAAVAGHECDTGLPNGYRLSNGQCVAKPTCAAGSNLKSYNTVFCPDNESDLSIEVQYQVGGNTVNSSFFCYQAFDLLQNMNNASKKTVCTSNADITLPNRARLFGLGTMPMHAAVTPAGDPTPAILLIKYDSCTNPLFGDNNEIASMSDSTTGYVVVFPNGRMTSKDEIKAVGGANFVNLDVSDIKCGLVPKPTKDQETQNPCANNPIDMDEKIQAIKNICGTNGFKCDTTATNSVFKEFDDDEKGENMGSEPQ